MSLCQIVLRQSVLKLTIRPSMMPKLSWMTLARGARQLVVQEALLWRDKVIATEDFRNKGKYFTKNSCIMSLQCFSSTVYCGMKIGIVVCHYTVTCRVTFAYVQY